MVRFIRRIQPRGKPVLVSLVVERNDVFFEDTVQVVSVPERHEHAVLECVRPTPIANPLSPS